MEFCPIARVFLIDTLNSRPRKLDDEDLDSGDDEGRYDRDPFGNEDDELEYGAKPDRIITYDANLQRMQDPEVTDNDVCNGSIAITLYLIAYRFTWSTCHRS